jgi:Protein of unknown function (DUF1236)
MMNTKNALLMSVAVAALIAGAGIGIGDASAQAPPSPAVQQNAPAEKTMHDPKGASQNKAPDAGVKSGNADEKMEHKGGRPEHAQDSPKTDGKPSGMRSETKSPGKTSSEMEADPKNKADMKSPQKTGDAKAGARDQGTAGGSVKLSAEQHTTMRAAIQQYNARPMTNVNFSTSVGSRVPRNVHFYRMPEEMVYFYPHWRGYDYFLVSDEIFVVNPRTHEIVAVLDA